MKGNLLNRRKYFQIIYLANGYYQKILFKISLNSNKIIQQTDLKMGKRCE